MAITIDRLTQIISVPQSDLALLSGTLYSADTDQIRLDIKAIEASEEGIVWEDTNVHNTTVELFGVTYARTLQYIAPYSIEFTPDSLWSVRLEGSNNNMGDVEAGILVQNQVQVIPTNSAGLIDLEILIAAAYQGQVVINPTTGQSGTTKPIGTFERPSDNLTDTLAIAVREGLPKILVADTLAVTSGDYSAGYNFEGTSPTHILTISATADVSNCNFNNLTVVGELDGLNLVKNCTLGAITNLSGFVDNTAFESTVTLNGATFLGRCYSKVVGAGFASIDSGSEDVILRDYHGSIQITGKTGGSASIEVYGGRIIIAATCIGGSINLRGDPMEIIDNSGVGCTVTDETGSYKVNDMWNKHIFETYRIYIDTEAAAAGDGSQNTPFNNLTTAIDKAEAIGVTDLVVLADIVLDRSLKNFRIIGVGVPTIDCNGQDLTRSEFDHVGLEGTYTGTVVAQDSLLLTGFLLNGYFENCTLDGDLTCLTGSDVLIKNCSSNIAGLSRPSISLNGAGTVQLSVRSYSGGIDIRDCNTPGDNCTVELVAGSVSLAASCTDGNIVIRGVGALQDSSTGTTVTDELVSAGYLSTTQDTRLKELYQLRGLDSGNPMVVTPSSVTVDGINQTISGDPATSITVTRT